MPQNDESEFERPYSLVKRKKLARPRVTLFKPSAKDHEVVQPVQGSLPTSAGAMPEKEKDTIPGAPQQET